jgi:FLVCR family feline leukemia virus subgroup C receptor-related protein
MSETIESSEKAPLISTKEEKEGKKEDEIVEDPPVIKTYWQRWLVLFVFTCHLVCTNIFWICFGSIAVEAECYYGVDVFWINSLSYVYFIVYCLFFILAPLFLERFGLRWTAIVGGSFNACGAWLRFAGSGANYFWLLLVGQSVCVITNLLEWSAPSLVSATWFPQNERAFATATVGATAPQVGILIGLLLSPLIVHSNDTSTVCAEGYDRSSLSFINWQSAIYDRLFYYLLAQAILATVLLPITFMVPRAPPTPPSISRQMEVTESPSFMQSIRMLSKNVNFIFFTFVFAMMLAVPGAYVTVYDEVFTAVGYNKYQGDMGYLGLAMQVACIAGLLIIGRWLDWTKTFYGSTVFICVISTLTGVGLSVATQFGLNFYALSVICAIAVGFSVMFQGVGYEFGVEMTYPVPESISASIMNAFCQLLATLMILGCSEMIRQGWSIYVFWALTICTLLPTLVQFFINPYLRRVTLDDTQLHSRFNIWRRCICCKRTEKSLIINNTRA